MVYLLDADLNGADSVRNLIDAGFVTHLPCPTYIAFEKHVKELLPKVGPDDLIVLDTITKLADTTRGDMKLGVDEGDALWDKRSIYFSDKNYLTVYEAAGQVIMRRLRNLRARGARVITTAHEDEQLDQLAGFKKAAPAINEALYKSLLGSSSDMFRLRMTMEDTTDSEGNVILPAYSRILQLRADDSTAAKFHVALEDSPKVPKNIPNPTLRKVYKALQGKKPSWLVLYGPPGVGKTTLACSDAAPPKGKAAE